MTAADEVPAAPPGPELQPPKTPRSFGGKSISRFNLFRDPDAPQSSPGSKSPYSQATQAQATQAQAQAREQHTPAQLQPPPLIPNLVLSGNKNDSTPSLLERRFFGGDLKPPPSPSARSFVSEPGSPLGSHFGTPLSRTASRTEREIDELAAQLDLELDEARRRKAEALQSCQEEDAARCADDVARLEAERELVIDEQRKFDLARLQAQPPSTPSSKPKRVLEKLNLFSRSARKPSSSNLGQPPLTPLPPATPNSVAPSIFTPTPSIGGRSSLDDSPPFNPSQRMSFIQPHPDGDAPISAINGGERVSARWLAPCPLCDSAQLLTPLLLTPPPCSVLPSDACRQPSNWRSPPGPRRRISSLQRLLRHSMTSMLKRVSSLNATIPLAWGGACGAMSMYETP